VKREVYKQDSAFAGLANGWKGLLEESSSDDVFLTWQWQSTWWKHFGKDKALRLLALSGEEGSLLGLASFYIESSTEGKRILRFLGGVDVADYLDIIAKSGCEVEVCKNTLEFWSSIEEEWDVVVLHCLRETSITLNVLKWFAIESKYSVEISQEDVCPRIFLPESWEEYLGSLSKKDRHELRRKIRRLERSSESVKDYSIKNPESLPEGMELFMSLHRKSDTRKESFMDWKMKVFFQAFADILFQEDWLKLSFLQVDGCHVATSLCFDYQNKIYLYNSGYNPEHSSLSPGIVLVAYLIREAIESGRSEFDFLRGDEPYKYRLGAKDSVIYRMTIRKR